MRDRSDNYPDFFYKQPEPSINVTTVEYDLTDEEMADLNACIERNRDK